MTNKLIQIEKEKIKMNSLKVVGGNNLDGLISIDGAKNSVLVLIAASLLTNDEVIIHNVPDLTDITSMIEVVESIGVSVKREKNTLIIDASEVNSTTLSQNLVCKLRASFFCIGSLLARFGYVEMPLPGGCSIGVRPVNEHISGLKSLGAIVDVEYGVVRAYILNHPNLIGDHICLSVPSVGATETLMMASVFCDGETILENCAMEPEVEDLANFLNSMGADIKGAGTSIIRIVGVKSLHGTEYTSIPDRIEAGTYLIAGAITRSNLMIKNVIPHHLEHVIHKLKEMGCIIWVRDDAISINSKNLNCNFNAVDIKTSSYPGFPTDLQAPFLSLLSTSSGVSVVYETIYENRMKHACELQRMGANIRIINNIAVIEGNSYLMGAHVNGSDLRATAALTLAGLFAEGETIISGVEYLDRGYSNFAEKLTNVGADVQRI